MIRGRLGRGGMGEVFLADQMGPLGAMRQVALKRMLPRLSHEESVVRMFLEEMGIAARLNHPNIATIYDFGEVEGVYYMAMEYVAGKPVNRLLKRLGPLSIPAAIAITKAVLEALAYAHRQRDGARTTSVIHQDVSPHNVIMATTGQIKLLDFGIARTEAAALSPSELRAKRAYAAPEQLEGAPPDRRFDLWAVGATLYELLTGVRPFGDRGPGKTPGAEPKPIEALRPEAAMVSALIARALTRDPEGRWPTAEDFLQALANLDAALTDYPPSALARLVDDCGGAHVSQDLGEITATGVAALSETALSQTPVVERISDSQAGKAQAPDGAAEPASGPGLKLTVGAGLLLGGALLLLALVFAPSAFQRFETGEPGSASTGAVPAPRPGPPQVVPLKRATAPKPEASAPKTAAKTTPAAKPIRKKKSRRRQKRPPRTRPTRAPKRPAATAPTTPARAGSSQPALRPGFGVLSVRTTPWARVLANGRVLGEGIIAKKPLAAGIHRLRLIPGQGGHDPMEVQVRVEPGKETRVLVNLDTKSVRITPE